MFIYRIITQTLHLLCRNNIILVFNLNIKIKKYFNIIISFLDHNNTMFELSSHCTKNSHKKNTCEWISILCKFKKKYLFHNLFTGITKNIYSLIIPRKIIFTIR